MACVYFAARNCPTVAEIPEALLLFSEITLLRSLFPSSKRSHFESTTQSMRASGNVSRSAAAAGRACTMSPSDPSRTSRKRGSAIFLVTQAGDEFARGMFLGITDDCYADPEKRCKVAFWNSLRRVIGAFRVHIRLEFAQQSIYIEFVEDHNVIHSSQSGYQRSARAFCQNWPAGSFQRSRAGIRIHTHDEQVAFFARRLQIAHVSQMQ